LPTYKAKRYEGARSPPVTFSLEYGGSRVLISPTRLAASTLIAVIDRYFADTGHALDFLKKAFEAVDLVGWHRANAE
jgi:hypothetical protein